MTNEGEIHNTELLRESLNGAIALKTRDGHIAFKDDETNRLRHCVEGIINDRLDNLQRQQQQLLQQAQALLQ